MTGSLTISQAGNAILILHDTTSNTNKYLRNEGGYFQIVNSTNSALIFNIDDAGNASFYNTGTFSGAVTTPTPATADNSTTVATTAYVKAQGYLITNQTITLSGDISGSGTGAIVTTLATVNSNVGAFQGITVNGKGLVTGAVNMSYAPLASPTFTGVPAAPTPVTADNTTAIATTAFVKAQNYLIGNQTITLSGDISGSGTTAITTTLPNINLNVGSFQGITVNAKGQVTGAVNQNYITGNQTITLSGDVSGSGATAITSTLATVNSNVGTFQGITVNGKGLVTGAVNMNYAPLASPTFTGVPAAPTATAGTNTTQLATTAFVLANTSTVPPATVAPIMDSVAAVGVATKYAREDHVHPSDTSRAPLASPALTGTPTAPTPAVSTNTTQLATTAYVVGQAATVAPLMNSAAAIGASLLYARQDHVHASDTSRAPLASPAFTGTPTAPTVTPGSDSTTKIATTAFVQSAITAVSSGVTSFNGRSGVVNFLAADITGVGGALLAGPTFTGVPAAPTAAVGTVTTQLATTAFVDAFARFTHNMHYSFSTGTGAGFWLDDSATADRFFFGSDSAATNNFRIYSALATANLLAVQANATPGSSTWSMTGSLTVSAAASVGGALTVTGGGTFGGSITCGDIYASRSATQGVIFLGSNGSHYLYFDGTNYNLPGSSLILGGGLNAAGAATIGGGINVSPASGGAYIGLNAPGPALTNQAMVNYNDNGVGKWQVGKQSDNSFLFYDVVAGASTLYSSAGTGYWSTTTPPVGDSTTRLATTAFVGNAALDAGTY
jgi:hypothetical protein